MESHVSEKVQSRLCHHYVALKVRAQISREVGNHPMAGMAEADASYCLETLRVFGHGVCGDAVADALRAINDHREGRAAAEVSANEAL